MVYISYDSSTNSWKPWRLMRIYIRDLCINSTMDPLTKFSTNNRITKVEDILSQNISQAITRTNLFSTVNGNSGTTMIRISQWKATIDKIVVSEEKSKLKRAGLRESQSKILALINQSKNIFCSSIKVTLILVSLFLTSQVNIQTSKQLEE